MTGSETMLGICKNIVFVIVFHDQPTVTFPIRDHVNVLHYHKKTAPSKILKLLTCRYHHLIDTMIEFSQSLVLLTHLKCLNVPYLSFFFTNFCMNYYARVPCGENYTYLKLLCLTFVTHCNTPGSVTKA